MLKKLFILLATVVTLSGCEHKELCYRHPHTVPVVIDANWEEFIQKETPTGMTVLVYPVGGYAATNGIETKRVMSNNIYEAEVQLEEGIYNSILFNQSETEFGSISFRNLESYNTAEVAISPAPTKWYTKTDDEVIGYEPEWFGTDTFEGAEVTKEMVLNYADATTFNRAVDKYRVIHHTAENIIYTTYITVHIQNVYNLKSARGALQGMAEGYLLGAGNVNNKKVTHLVEQWSLTTDENDPTNGYIKAKILCFGLPGNHTAQAAENKLKLSLLLVDNKTQVDSKFEVGHIIEKSTQEGAKELYITVTLADPLPDVKPEGGSEGGFSASVEDWGEEIEHKVEI